MTRLRLSLVGVVLALVLPVGPSSVSRPMAAPAARIVAIGDVHGNLDALRGILQEARVIDRNGRWTGGAATLVQTGDLTDRGSQVRGVMNLLMALEREARKSGGRVEVLLGNHEGMNVLGELRDTAATAFEAFVDERSERRRAEAYEQYARLAAARSTALALRPSTVSDRPEPVEGRQAQGAPSPSTSLRAGSSRGGSAPPPYQVKSREEWMAAHPPGYLEYREALAPDGPYGRWLRSKDAVTQIGDTVFLHGGISPEVATRRVQDINQQIRSEIRTFDQHRRYLVSAELILPFFTLQETLEAVQAEAGSLKLDPERLTEEQVRHVTVLRDLLKIDSSWLLAPEGPLWFRGYAQWNSEEGATLIGPILEKYRARHIVVGHTPFNTYRITPRFDHRVFLIDTGMLSSHFRGGRASALEIQDGRFTAIYTGERVVLTDTTAAGR